MPRQPPTDAEFRKEILDRLRRVETRITRFMEFMGMDTGVQRPVFHNNKLDIPTDATSLRDILAALPAGVTVEIEHKGVLLAHLTRQ